MAEKPDKVDPLRRGRELASYYACHQEKDPGFLTKADISWVKEYCDCQDAEDGHPDKWDTNKASATATRSWWRKEMEKLDKAKGTEGVPPTAATAVVVAVPASLPVSDHGLQHIVPVPSLNTPAIASLPNDDTQRVSPASQSQTLPATSPVPVPVINQTHQRPPVSPIPTSSTSLPRSSHIRRSVFSSPEPSDIGRVSVPELKRLFDGWNGESTTEQLRPSNTSHPHPAREKVSETVPFGPVLYQYYLDKRRGVLPPKTSLAEQVLERIETTEVIGNDVFAAKITGEEENTGSKVYTWMKKMSIAEEQKRHMMETPATTAMKAEERLSLYGGIAKKMTTSTAEELTIVTEDPDTIAMDKTRIIPQGGIKTTRDHMARGNLAIDVSQKPRSNITGGKGRTSPHVEIRRDMVGETERR
ncbi:hypothetical protein ACHAP7_011041 [Fusarium lateritium]